MINILKISQQFYNLIKILKINKKLCWLNRTKNILRYQYIIKYY